MGNYCAGCNNVRSEKNGDEKYLKCSLNGKIIEFDSKGYPSNCLLRYVSP